MNELAIVAFVFAFAAMATATHDVPSYLLQRAPPPVYRNVPPPQDPTGYRYDVRFEPLQYGYSAPATVPVYAVPPEYAVPQLVPASYVPTAPVPYVHPRVLASLPAHPFIGRHFRPAARYY